MRRWKKEGDTREADKNQHARSAQPESHFKPRDAEIGSPLAALPHRRMQTDVAQFQFETGIDFSS